jgi:hypothetical protein
MVKTSAFFHKRRTFIIMFKSVCHCAFFWPDESSLYPYTLSVTIILTLTFPPVTTVPKWSLRVFQLKFAWTSYLHRACYLCRESRTSFLHVNIFREEYNFRSSSLFIFVRCTVTSFISHPNVLSVLFSNTHRLFLLDGPSFTTIQDRK